MKWLGVLGPLIGACLLLVMCRDATQYRAEVGYHEGSDEKWHIGHPQDRREDCTAEAIGMYNRLNAEKPGRAFSWACLVVDASAPNRFKSRVR